LSLRQIVVKTIVVVKTKLIASVLKTKLIASVLKTKLIASEGK